MTPQKQKFRHDPDKGIYGDCWRTAIACILDKARDQVPHFYESGDGELCGKLTHKYLEENNFYMFRAFFDAGYYTLPRLLNFMDSMITEGAYYLLSGTSKNQCGHVVICQGNKIVWDPALDDSGIIGPMDDGNYWIELIGYKGRDHREDDRK